MTNLLETIKKYYRVDRKKICFIKFIIEAYDGIAVLSTIDPVQGIIELCISPGCEKDAVAIIDDLAKDIMIEPKGSRKNNFTF